MSSDSHRHMLSAPLLAASASLVLQPAPNARARGALMATSEDPVQSWYDAGIRLSPPGKGLPAEPELLVASPLSMLQGLAGSAAAAAGEEEVNGDELDYLDTSDSWDQQLAEMEAWQAAQKSEAAPPELESAETWDGTIDEEAHFGFGGDDEGGSEAAVPLPATPVSDKAVLNSLEAVLNALARLDEKMTTLEAKVDAVQAELRSGAVSAPSPGSDSPTIPSSSSPAQSTATPAKDEASGGWDGEVDESAWFDEDDDDDDDMPDWRDVRRLNKLL